MAFQMYYNQFNNKTSQSNKDKNKAQKRLSKVINHASLGTIEEKSPGSFTSLTGSNCNNDESSDIALPAYIPFVRDEINRKWMESKMRKFEYEYGFKISRISDDDWLPTPHGLTMSDALIKTDELKAFFTNKKVLELGSGVGNHTALILKQKPAHLTVTEISESRMNVTKSTLNANNISQDNMSFVIGDWLQLSHKLDKNNNKFDVLITNPPFAASGRRNRRYFIDELILNSWRYLKDNGHLIFIQSSMALIEQTVFRLKQNGYIDINIVYASKYYWRDYYFYDKTFLNEADENKNKFGYNSYDIDYENGNKRIETLYVVMARLKPWSGTSIQH